MKRVDPDTSPQTSTARRHRLREAARLQEIEGNPLDAEDLAMFAMFEREGWSHERRRAYIIALAKGHVPRPDAAE